MRALAHLLGVVPDAGPARAAAYAAALLSIPAIAQQGVARLRLRIGLICAFGGGDRADERLAVLHELDALRLVSAGVYLRRPGGAAAFLRHLFARGLLVRGRGCGLAAGEEEQGQEGTEQLGGYQFFSLWCGRAGRAGGALTGGAAWPERASAARDLSLMAFVPDQRKKATRVGEYSPTLVASYTRQAHLVPAMNWSSCSRATSSRSCSGGCFMV